MTKASAIRGFCSMPFRNQDISAFGPEELAVLHAVFDLAWQRVLSDGFDELPLIDARRRLAKCIMAHAKPGQLDVPMMLKDCLAQFRQRDAA
jgi:hypothetical protein